MSESKPISSILHENNQYYAKTRHFFIWLPINMIFLSVVLGDIWKHNRANTVIVVLEYVIAVILSLNIMYLCCQRFLIQYFPKKYKPSLEQLDILRNFKNQIQRGKDKYSLNMTVDQPTNTKNKKEKIYFERFRASSSLFATPSPAVKPDISNDGGRNDKFPPEHYRVSPASFFAGTPIVSDSSHNSSLNSFNNYLGLSGNYESFSNPSIGSSVGSKSFSSFIKDDGVDDIDSFRKYIDRGEFKQAQSLNETTDANAYWRSRDSMFHWHQNMQRSDLALNDIYQLSPTSALEYVKPVNEVSSLGANPKVCKKFGIDQAYLSDWIANLRMWITQTILSRIIKEIKDVNVSMSSHGVANISIGSSGLERLKKAAAMSHVFQNIPSLPSLISFLDISTNQEYVVQRITALSTGSMSNYCWNSGGTYEGKPWNDSLPTDAALVMHLVAAYFDSQLFPRPHAAPDGRQFSSVHYIRTPAVLVKNKKSLIIYQQTINPPHFQLIIGEDTYDISRGRNNLFHVLLFFLQHIKTRESGMFEHVNLGSSGINMLWIINEPSHNAFKKL